MNYLFTLGLALGCSFSLMAQETVKPHKDSNIQLTKLVDLESTDVKDQNRSGTCWSFSSLSFLESELIRMGKGRHDLAEMFVVHQVYLLKAQKFVRMHGKNNFGPGGAFHDPLYILKHIGLVPQAAFPGLKYGEEEIFHGELDAVLEAYVKAVVSNPNRRLSTAWLNGLEGILNAYLGEAPEQFSYQGKSYTPRSFADDMGLKAEQYVDLTSFTHHPFYASFPIEIPDNWSWESAWNLPIDELMQVLDHALENGFTVAWGADVSDKGFMHRDGIAVLPEGDWATKDADARKEAAKEPLPQQKVSQAMRQEAFDRYETTDDHGMQITGKYKDQNGTVYYKVKNSWGDDSNDCGGYFYATAAYLRLRTINFLVHRDAVPAAILSKLNL